MSASATAGYTQSPSRLEPASPGPARIVAALARAETRRLLHHPLFLGGVALTAFWFASQPDIKPADMHYGGSSENLGMAYFNLMGYGVLPLAFATLLAVNRAALRSGRHQTDELYAALPAPARARTSACLLAGACAPVIAVVLVAAAYRYLSAGDGLVVDFDGRTAVPSVYELAQGPLLVAALGMLGVVLAAWLPGLAAALAAVFTLLVAETLLTWWNITHSTLRRLFPFANSATYSRPHATFPQRLPADHGVDGFAVAAAGWHLLYLAALAALLATLALLRHGPRRRLLAPAVGALVVLIAAAAAQLSAPA